MRDAVGHGAPTLGLVAGDVRAGRVHQGDGPRASRRSDCVHCGDVDARQAPTLERYQQLSDAKSVDRTKRPFRLPNGKPNLAGEWAQEQQVLATPPGGRIGLVPISQAAAIRAGKLPMPDGPAGWFPPPVTLTAAGHAAAEALRKRPTSENPRLSCQITSILFDWVFDGTINRITQSANAIKMEYGAGLTRTVHMNMTAHPAMSRRAAAVIRSAAGTAIRSSSTLSASRPAAWQAHSPQQQTARRRALHAESRNARAHPRHRRRRSRLLRGQVRGFR